MRYGKVQLTGDWIASIEAGTEQHTGPKWPANLLMAMGGAKKQAEKGKSMRAVGLEPTT